jgi:hypothetical protein
VHGEDHYRAEQYEQSIGTIFVTVHAHRLPVVVQVGLQFFMRKCIFEKLFYGRLIYEWLNLPADCGQNEIKAVLHRYCANNAPEWGDSVPIRAIDRGGLVLHVITR